MIDILLVRHGEAEIPWSQGADAGLSDRGRAQADSLARELVTRSGADLVSSPLLRARETARPLGQHRARDPSVDARYCEVPIVNDVARRKAWLTEVHDGTWNDVDPSISAWREAAWAGLLGLSRDTIIVTHFMLINAMVTRATADPRLVCFEPDYVSVTALRLVPGGRCDLVAPGRSMN